MLKGPKDQYFLLGFVRTPHIHERSQTTGTQGRIGRQKHSKVGMRRASEASLSLLGFQSRKKKPLRSGWDTRVGCLVYSVSVCESVCVIQHLFGPPFTTALDALDALVDKSSYRGLCARTHTLYTFLSWWCGKPFTIRRARCGNVCRHMSVSGRVLVTKS